MLNSFCKSIFRKTNSNPLQISAPAYTFILGRMFKNKAAEEDAKKEEEVSRRQAVEFQAQKKRMKKQVEQQSQYDMMQRQKEIELNRDFRTLEQKYKNTIPSDVGKLGFDQLVYWSQNAQTPQQIADMIKKFNSCPKPKAIEDQQTFSNFIQNVKATVYLAESYPAMVDYAHFGYKYSIEESEFWLKIEQKCSRKPPRTDQQFGELIDILFVMANVSQGEVIFSSSQKLLANRQFTVEQIAKLIISFFRTQRGQKQWVTGLLVSLEMQMGQVTCDVVESVLPILKQSKNVPRTFEDKLEQRLIQLESELPHSLVCIAASYFGFGKGGESFWRVMESKAREHYEKVKNERGRIPSAMLAQVITGIMSSYKFSSEYMVELLIPELEAKQCRVLSKLPSTVLSSLSKNLYIYELQQRTQLIEQTIQGVIMRNFAKISQVTSEELIKVLKDYTVTRLGSREFYLFLESIVNDKLADIKTQKFTVDALYAIYQESNLCSTDTLELLKKLAYE